MRYVGKIILATLLLSLAYGSSVHAVDLGAGLLKSAATSSGFDAQTTSTTFAETIGGVIQVLLEFVGVIFLVLMVYAGFLWMTARGEDSQIDKAKKIITSSIVGLIITVGAYSITRFIVPRIIDRAIEQDAPQETSYERAPAHMTKSIDFYVS